MTGKFHVTYEIVTHESGEAGEASDAGFVLPGNWHVDTATALADTAGEYGMSLREACTLVECPRDTGRWFSEEGERLDYATGAAETRALHPPQGITPSSYRRLARLLRA